ncbi:sugar (pentulose and hexulose) kinase [Longilinea arvoryzae]|uniref:Sugar (Pentulose and hexulose) kinase n=2 Tax=Longilinea arvoryzae TaxID=360412 RepID=A0A0S7BI66_9CHLR|nr:sugar (pentulose and hexulose) kinase [Longilinea arvoryzae]
MEGCQNSQKGYECGKMILGIEFGSTRIKAILIDQNHEPIVSGSHEWENQYVNDFWTYSLESIWVGLQDCYSKLADAFNQKFQHPLSAVSAIGFSAMMHGYMPFGKDGDLLVPFRSWRNTTTGQAAEQLTELFQFNIPQRWSIAHLYQAILNGESHVADVRYLTTLAGYIHWKLTGRKVLGIGDASGMFPIDGSSQNFDRHMMELFNSKVAEKNYPWRLEEILPEVAMAGNPAGFLSEEGARLLDPSGRLQAGIPLCPPEGDAGTGMVATNSVAEQTGNISAGTSIFAMIVLQNKISKVYPEIDIVSTPAGKPVAMVHSNNCTSDLNAWVELFHEFSSAIGQEVSQPEIFERLFQKALEGEADCGGLLAYNYFSGEPITRLEEGRPLFVRMPDSRFSLANFMRMHLYSAIATLRIGMDILFIDEQVRIGQLLGHGGFFKTKSVGQRIMAAALNVPVSVMETAGEGGAWGIALLAAYMLNKGSGESLESYLSKRVFTGAPGSTIYPDQEDVRGFAVFMGRYKEGLIIEKTAVQSMK